MNHPNASASLNPRPSAVSDQEPHAPARFTGLQHVHNASMRWSRRLSTPLRGAADFRPGRRQGGSAPTVPSVTINNTGPIGCGKSVARAAFMAASDSDRYSPLLLERLWPPRPRSRQGVLEGDDEGITLLVTAFFFMAALHVMHQAGYVADSYRDKRPEPHGLAGFSRGIDYGLLASSLFVLATVKLPGASLRLFGMDLSQHPFTTSGRQLLFPACCCGRRCSRGRRCWHSCCARRRS